MAIPETCADKIITLYHSSLFAGHQVVIKIYLAIADKFFIPRLIHYIHSYIKGYHICQLSRSDKPPTRQLQTRLYKGHKYILCIIDEVTGYLVTVLIHQSRSEEIVDALIENVMSKYFVPDYIIMDQDSAFMSLLMNYLFKKLDIKIKTVAP